MDYRRISSILQSAWEDPNAEQEIITTSRVLETEAIAGQHREPREDILHGLEDSLRFALSKYGLSKSGYDLYKAIYQIGMFVGVDLPPVSPTDPLVYEPSSVRFINPAYMPQFLPLLPTDDTRPPVWETVFHHFKNGRFTDTAGVATIRMGMTHRLSVPVVAVLGAPMPQRVEPSNQKSSTPVVVVLGKLSECSSMLDNARSLLHEGCDTALEISKRNYFYRTLPSPLRASSRPVPVHSGSSIGSAGQLNKGSVSLYVRSTIGEERILTAAHVVKKVGIPLDQSVPIAENVPVVLDVVSPGRADVMKAIYPCLSEGETAAERIGNWMNMNGNLCGSCDQFDIGVDSAGWRADWGLVKLNDVHKGANGVWWEPDERNVLLQALGCLPPRSEVVEGWCDPIVGELWLKDGAATGWTAGRMITPQVHLFIRGTAAPGPDSPTTHLDNIEIAQVLMFKTETDEEEFAQSGDSGAGIYRVAKEGESTDGLVFGGHLVSLFRSDSGLALAMAVPASRLWAQMKDLTGVEWEIMH